MISNNGDCFWCADDDRGAHNNIYVPTHKYEWSQSIAEHLINRNMSHIVHLILMCGIHFNHQSAVVADLVSW